MEEQLKKVKSLLKEYNQEHLLQFYDELTESQKYELLSQILSINFEEILDLYEKSKIDIVENIEEIEPIPYFDKSTFSDEQINFYSKIGEDFIKKGEIAVITLAGGQGSRLGFKGPKGAFLLNTSPKISLFEVICNYLKNACHNFNVSIPWYIMTSTENYRATVRFFENNNFFGYPKDDIMFFMQDDLPIIDIDGKLVLEEIYKVKVASNGNGNLFQAMQKQHILSNMKSRNIKWAFIGGIDNVLLNPLDPLFIGISDYSGNAISAKTLLKEDPSGKAWVFAMKYHKPAIIDCGNFSNEISYIKDKNGNFLYRDINMLAHLFRIDALENMVNINLPYHRAFRKSPFVNQEGMKQIVTEPNIFKFEQFVFDAFSHFDNITLLRVNACEEFAPIKDFNGPFNPEAATKAYKEQILNVDSSDDD